MKILQKILAWAYKMYFTYTPKGKKEVMYQTALMNIETKETARKQISTEAKQMLDALYQKCVQRGHHRYALPKKGHDKAAKCLDCLFEVDKDPKQTKKLSEKLQGTGVELAIVD